MPENKKLTPGFTFSKPLSLCLEVNPPHGISPQQIFERLEGRLSGVDFINVTDCALARVRFASLPFAALLKQRFGIEPLANVTCRDRNLLAIQADLLAAWACGVHSVVAITGDAVTIGDSPERKAVFEVNALGLLNVIKTLNGGKDLSGAELKGSPDFAPGVVVNPNAGNPAVELRRLQLKKDAGACYAISQPVFDEESSASFFSEAKKIGIPILMGLLALKSAESFKVINKIPGIKIPEHVKQVAAESGSKDLSSFFLQHCLRLARLNCGLVAGFHVITGPNAALALELTRELASFIEAQHSQR